MILDTTLREGVQSRLWKLTDRQRLALARDLAAAGVREIEAGSAGRDHALPSLVRTVRAAGSKALVWSPTRTDLLAEALSCDPDGICLSVPVSEIHLRARIGVDRETMLRRLDDCLALLDGRFVVLGLEDASRAAPGFLEEVSTLARERGVSRLRIADTLGLLDPSSTARLVAWLGGISGLPIGFHGHDDFGMATANALAALDAGAACVDASLMGWGERAGIASTELVAAWLVFRRGELGPDPARLARLAHRTAKHTGLSIPSTRAIVGTDLFRCGSGLHVDGLQKDPRLYEPFEPSLLGRDRVIEYGAKTGRAALRKLLPPTGAPLHESALDSLVEQVRFRARQRGRPLSVAEVLQLRRRMPVAPTPVDLVPSSPNNPPIPSHGDLPCP